MNTQVDLNTSRTMFGLIKPALVEHLEPLLAAELERIRKETAPVKILTIVKDRVETTINGAFHSMTPDIIQYVHQGLNVMLVGPAGCGKTHIAHTIAEALGLPLTTVSCSAGMSEADLKGRLLPLGANGTFQYVESAYMRGYANGHVVLLDELDGADANLLLCLNSSTANGGMTVDGRIANGWDPYVKRHPNTIILAAANTWGKGADMQFVGRAPLDESTLDRFLRVPMDYDRDIEARMGTEAVVSRVHQIRDRARQAQLRRTVSSRMIQRITKVMAAGKTLEQAVELELVSWSADERRRVS